MESQILDEDDLKAQQAEDGVAVDGSLEFILDSATTIKDVLWHLAFYSELLAELMCKGWELADRPEGTLLFLRNPRYKAPSGPTLSNSEKSLGMLVH